MKHFTEAQLRNARADHPGQAIVEVVSGAEAALLAIPMPKSVLDAPIPSMPGMTLELLDGATINLPHQVPA